MAIPFQELSETFANNEAVNIAILENLWQIEYDTPSENNHLGRQMQKVPPILRLDKKNQQDYNPLVVSLGPYHHGKEELQLAEDFKLTALKMFVADSGLNVKFFFFEVFQRVNEAKNCYIGDSTKEYDDPTFAKMMLLDACFIIHFIDLSKSSTNLNVIRDHLGNLAYETAIRDLFLLENQIPFWILKLLICLRYGNQEGEEMLNVFLDGILFGENKGGGKATRDEELPFHLLDAFRLVLVSQSPKEKPTTPILSYGKYVPSFRSATDLKAKGIHFRPSSDDSFMGIKFKSGYFYALLEVPCSVVMVYTKVFFLNVIAYEMCASTGIDRPLTAYIEFMKLLIDIPKDVKELREKRILLTTLGSDEDVVKVYKEINTYGMENVSIFDDVKVKIQAHYNNKAKTWLAELTLISGVHGLPLLCSLLLSFWS